MRWGPAWVAVGLILLLPATRPRSPDPIALKASAVAAPSPARPAAPADSASPRDSALAASGAADSAAIADTLAAAPPPPRDYLAEVRANFTPENRAYSGTRVVLAFIEPVYVIMLLLVLLFSGISARLRDIARNLGHRRYVQVLVYFALLSAIAFVLEFPFDWYSGFALEHQYHLSTQSFWSWLGDDLKSVGLSVLYLGVLPLFALAYWRIEKGPRSWWLWFGAATLPIVTATLLLSPLIYDPVFNKFTPLRDPVLRENILALAKKAGIPARRVFEVDKSAQTRRYNAYVTGFGASQRIVLYDTVLQGMKQDEILVVMGHEMGHYRLGHIWKTILFFSLGSFVVFFLAWRINVWALRRWGESWGVREMHDVATMPLFGISLTLLLVATQPLAAAFSRGEEHEADVFGLEVTRSNDAGARAFLKLGQQNRSNPEPSPFVRAVLYDHPPLAERIRFMLEYRPWERGAPNRFYREAR